MPACGTSPEPQSRVFRHRARARKPELQKFVTIRVHSWFRTTPSSLIPPTTISFVSIRGSKNTNREVPSGQISGSKARATEIRDHPCPFVVQNDTTREAPSEQISGWKAQATEIRVHSCPFVVQKTPLAKSLQGRSRAGKPKLQKFVTIRVHSWFRTTPSSLIPPTTISFVSIRGSKNTNREVPSGQISGSKARATKIRVHSCPFVVQKNTTCEVPSEQISGSKARATKIRVHSCPFVVQKNTTCEVPSEQISGSKARATKIRVHSCPFVVQKNTTCEVPSEQISGSKARATKIRVHSCPFVVQNTPLAKTLSEQISGSKARATKIRDHSYY